METNNKATLISNIKDVLTAEAHQRIQIILRKKASMYGLSQLRNPQNYKKRQTILIPHNLRQNSSFSNKSAQKQKISSQKIPQLSSRLQLFKQHSKNQRLFPYLNTFNDLLLQQRQITHVFKDKLQHDIDDIVFYYMRILVLAIQYEGIIFQNDIEIDKCVLIFTLQTITESLLELGYKQIAFFLAAVAVEICQFYKQLKSIGKFLLIMAKVLRKLFKYNQSIILLKKSLEYVWLQRRLNQQQQQNHKNFNQFKSNHQIQSPNTNNIKIKKDNQYNINQQLHNYNNPNNKNLAYHNKNGIKTSRAGQNSRASINVKQYLTQVRNMNKNKSTQSLSFGSSTDTQLQIYNQLSYCLLQLNKKQQSIVFGQKYQIGFIQKQTSNVLSLSRDLINSAQKRIIKWQRVDKKRIYMLLGVQLDQYLMRNEQNIKYKFNQNKLLNDMKFSFDFYLQNFLIKDMFFYQIPLPLQFPKQQLNIYKSYKRLPRLAVKFVIKTSSTTKKSRANSLKLNKNINMKRNQKIQQNKILIYRQIGFCRTKLSNLLKKYIIFVKKVVNLNINNNINKNNNNKNINIQNKDQNKVNHNTQDVHK